MKLIEINKGKVEHVTQRTWGITIFSETPLCIDIGFSIELDSKKNGWPMKLLK